MKILLVEDDEALRESVSSSIPGCTSVRTIKEARELINSSTFDLAIIDVGLPDGSGFSLAKDINNRFPFIFLTASHSAEFRLEGLEAGAADYIPKPFLIRELQLRIERILGKIGIGVTLDKDSRRVILADGSIFVPQGGDFDILCTLIENAPKVVNRKDFPASNPRSVDNAVVRLREGLGKFNRIRSVRAIGYQWDVS
jgi:DNA-binding response OmpR family regulator